MVNLGNRIDFCKIDFQGIYKINVSNEHGADESECNVIVQQVWVYEKKCNKIFAFFQMKKRLSFDKFCLNT